MAYAFDTLGYAKRLRDAGVEVGQAEAHAEAAREFIMTELVTKPDLLMVRADLQTVRADLQTATAQLQKDIAGLRAEFQKDMESQTLRLTVRFGSLMVVGVSALALLQRLH